MLLPEQLYYTHTLATPESWSTVQQHLPEAWIAQALQATGITTLRRRRLPMEQAVWLVLGIALLRDRSISYVADSLGVVLPGDTGIASSALSQARQRLGDEPLRWLFQHSAQQWARSDASYHWRGLSVLAMDGVVWRTPDTVANRAAFGGQHNDPNGTGPFPQVRAVCLLDARSRQLRDACFDAYDTSEYRLAERLLPSLPAHSLTLFDKGYFSASLLLSVQTATRHWLTPARRNCRHEVVSQHGDGDAQWRLPVSQQARQKQPDLPRYWEVRAITGVLPNGTRKTLLTSLHDPVQWPAHEVFALYRERWEIELAYAEVKTDMQKQMMTLRSQTPAGIAQELWATLLMYNLVRREITAIADDAQVEPVRISFTMALRYIIDEWLWSSNAAAGSIPAKLRAMRNDIKKFILPKRRTQRRYPRAVKLSKTQYPIKRKAAQLA